MEFFNKIKIKLKVRNLILAIGLFVFANFTVYLIISNGFSSDTDWKLGLRGTDLGIPLPNWLFSCIFILLCIALVCGMYSSLKSFFTNTEFNKLIQEVKEIGDAEEIGTMLSSISKNPYAKGDLRFNEKIIFYMKGSEVSVVSTVNIIDIQPVNKRTGKNKEAFIIVFYQNGKLLISTKEKNVLPLLEEMKRTFSTVS